MCMNVCDCGYMCLCPSCDLLVSGFYAMFIVEFDHKRMDIYGYMCTVMTDKQCGKKI